jgi:hypothetical protein
VAAAFLVALHWDQAAALAGAGGERADLALRPKRHPLPRRQVALLLGAIAALVAAPYGEELRRCYRVSRTLAPTGD